MALQKFFYSRLVYNAITIDFNESTSMIEITEIPIRGVNTSTAGVSETLFERVEVQVALKFHFIDIATSTALLTYWRNWGSLGKQATLTLDRLNTCAGQYEYDNYNTYFTKAELLNNPFAPKRQLLVRPLYQIVMQFRQGV